MLSKLAKEVAKKENAVAEDRKRLDDDFEDVGVWVQTKSSELLNADQHLEPLKAFAIEKKVGNLKKAEAEVKAYEEDALSRLRRNVMSVSRADGSGEGGEQQQPYSSDLKDIETSFENLKCDLRKRISSLEEMVEPRRKFEQELEASRQWLSKAEGAVGSETAAAPVNIATLDEHLRNVAVQRSQSRSCNPTLSILIILLIYLDYEYICRV